MSTAELPIGHVVCSHAEEAAELGIDIEEGQIICPLCCGCQRIMACYGGPPTDVKCPNCDGEGAIFPNLDRHKVDLCGKNSCQRCDQQRDDSIHFTEAELQQMEADLKAEAALLKLQTEWNDPATTPARLVELLGDGADEGKLRVWAEACERVWRDGTGFRFRDERLKDWREWIEYFSPRFREPENMTRSQAAAFLRCLFAQPFMPREMVECPETGNEVGKCRNGLVILRFTNLGPVFGTRIPCTDQDFKCRACKGTGHVPAPLIDERHISSDARNLAIRIQEEKFADHGSLLILGDALEERGANPEAVLHCREKVHCYGCWVVNAILSDL